MKKNKSGPAWSHSVPMKARLPVAFADVATRKLPHWSKPRTPHGMNWKRIRRCLGRTPCASWLVQGNGCGTGWERRSRENQNAQYRQGSHRSSIYCATSDPIPTEVVTCQVIVQQTLRRPAPLQVESPCQQQPCLESGLCSGTLECRFHLADSQ